ncbi:lysoplasmalogenase family protein [Pontixanthobacter aquaemixtae]|uniref:Lysoplasmalogenase n=1 Tax=Pontixanthobacter aquaemixtae TaxID=1958940 RepID=A0A844ZPK8_9SPHN|nr:lysoplasmalogenase [Pontixanthobacter aquaemixtae]MXO90291.1 lysoplasmalogenase [Pontixanthobacter aquaemixtae]
MPKRALTEKRPWLLASLVAAIGYYALIMTGQPVGEIWLMLVKGAGVALLAVYALQRHSSFAARLLALVLILSALGDMLIELSLIWGGAAFFASHLAAIALYLRNQRHISTISQKVLGAALLLITPIMCWLLTRDPAVTAYGVALGAMAASAWMSRFSRYRVGLGAVLFVVSDWLIFYGIGHPDGSMIPSLLIWPLYYCGQFLIATGVIQTLRQELPDAA